MNRKALAQLALVLLLAGWATWNFLKPADGLKIDLNPYKALGSVAAEETSKLLHGQGSIIIVIPDSGDDADPVLTAQVAAYRSGLKAAGKVMVQSVETVKMDPFQRMRTGGAMPSDQFIALLKRYPAAAAFVLFIGFPGLGDAEMGPVQAHPAKRIVISAALPDYRDLIQKKVLHLAIVPRTISADERLPAAKSLRETFDQEYVVLRPGG